MKIKLELNTEIELPQELIDDAPKQGPFDDYAEYIVSHYDIEANLQETQEYLKKFGAWDVNELQDLDDNIKRIMWLACLDCKENNTNYFYMGI